MRLEDWSGNKDMLTVRGMFLILIHLGMVDKAQSFNEFIEWMGAVSWYANIYKPR